MKEQQRAMQREREEEDRKMRDGMDNLGEMENNVAGLQRDIDNMQKVNNKSRQTGY